MKPDPKPPTLQSLLTALEPKIAAVKETEAAVVAIRASTRVKVAAANRERQAVVEAATKARDEAQALFDTVCAEAAHRQEKVATEAQRAVQAADRAYAAACDEARPLLAQLQAQTMGLVPLATHPASG